MNRDPIVEEIHQTRQKIWEECNGDLDQFLDRLQAAEVRDRSRGVTTIALPTKTHVAKSTEIGDSQHLRCNPIHWNIPKRKLFLTCVPVSNRSVSKFCEKLWRDTLQVVECNKIDMAYIRSEEFVDFLEDVLIRAVKTRAEEKRKKLAAVVAGRLQHAKSTPFDDRFLDLLLSLSDVPSTHFKRTLSGRIDERSNAKHRQPSHYDLPTEDYLFLVQDLISKALLYTDRVSRGDPSLFQVSRSNGVGASVYPIFKKNTTHAF